MENISRIKEKCVGCKSCEQSCPKHCISMVENKEGFWYPSVDEKSCIECKVCLKKCPVENTEFHRNEPHKVWAWRNKNDVDIMRSASGGAADSAARTVLQMGGVVYGAAYDEQLAVSHIEVTDEAEREKLQSSKYVQSDPKDSYTKVKQRLSEGKTVLFTGTPCQIAGVARFLEIKHADTTSLYTCDNICHGVPSPGVWKDYLEILKSKYMDTDAQITSINMRSKRVSWKKQVMDISVSKGNLLPVLEEFSFNKIFLSLFPVRPSCFHCHYTSYKRPADFTLGDFWNVDSAGIKFDVTGGVNEVLVNTEKGRKLFVLIRENAVYQPVSKASGWQPHLEYSTKAPGNQEAFWTEYSAAADLKTKEALLRKYMKGSTLTRIIRKVNPILQKTGLYSIAGKMYKKVFVKK